MKKNLCDPKDFFENISKCSCILSKPVDVRLTFEIMEYELLSYFAKYPPCLTGKLTEELWCTFVHHSRLHITRSNNWRLMHYVVGWNLKNILHMPCCHCSKLLVVTFPAVSWPGSFTDLKQFIVCLFYVCINQNLQGPSMHVDNNPFRVSFF